MLLSIIQFYDSFSGKYEFILTNSEVFETLLKIDMSGYKNEIDLKSKTLFDGRFPLVVRAFEYNCEAAKIKHNKNFTY